MSLTYRWAKDFDAAKVLVRDNMQSYYRQLNASWNEQAFAQSWLELANIDVVFEEQVVGLLRLDHQGEKITIRDLQIAKPWRNCGVGSRVIKQLIDFYCAEQQQTLRLRVFKRSPARAFYSRHGFVTTLPGDAVFTMEHPRTQVSPLQHRNAFTPFGQNLAQQSA